LFNPRTVALRDGQFRRALSLALNREELIPNTILKGIHEPLVRPASSPFPTSSYGHNRLLAEPMFDPQRAAVLSLTARKQRGGDLPVLRLSCPPDPAIQDAATQMIEAWRRVGITVRLIDNSTGSADQADDWDMVYRVSRIVEPLTEFWPMLTLQPDATVESLKPLPERMRRQLLELDRSIDWTSATKLIHRIETELLIEARYIPLWEEDEFFVSRRQLVGLPVKLINAFHDVERWTLQSWYPTETP
jgi:ABC-type transport system substrate-binding protein